METEIGSGVSFSAPPLHGLIHCRPISFFSRDWLYRHLDNFASSISCDFSLILSALFGANRILISAVAKPEKGPFFLLRSSRICIINVVLWPDDVEGRLIKCSLHLIVETYSIISIYWICENYKTGRTCRNDQFLLNYTEVE